MAKPTTILIIYDDGTTTDIPAKGVGSIFMNENKAKKCGHNPPYGKPPKKEDAGNTSTLMAMSTTADEEEDAVAGSCYMVNGVIVCP